MTPWMMPNRTAANPTTNGCSVGRGVVGSKAAVVSRSVLSSGRLNPSLGVSPPTGVAGVGVGTLVLETDSLGFRVSVSDVETSGFEWESVWGVSWAVVALDVVDR